MLGLDQVGVTQSDNAEEGTAVSMGKYVSDNVYLQAQMWSWLPVLKLEEGAEYVLHLSSVDVNHGFSLFPLNINFQVVPGYDYGLRVKPTQSGEFEILCNEFCGVGHHLMVGKVIVVPAGSASAAPSEPAAPGVGR